MQGVGRISRECRPRPDQAAPREVLLRVKRRFAIESSNTTLGEEVLANGRSFQQALVLKNVAEFFVSRTAKRCALLGW